MSHSSASMFAMYGAAGFYKAPVSKFLLSCAVLSSFAMMFPLQHQRSLLSSNPHLVLEKKQPWRLLTSKLAFLDLKDFLLCSLLLYYFRIFERRFGSRKYASYLLATSCMSIALEFAALVLCQHLHFHLDFMPTGLLCCVFPLFVPFYKDIPRVASTHILGVPFTGKTLTYILGFQVASGSAESRIVGLCGLVAGVLWQQNFLWVQKWLVVPRVVGQLCWRVLGPLLESKPPQGLAEPMGATLELQRQEQIDRMERQLMQQYQQFSAPTSQARNFMPGPGIFGNQNFPEGLMQVGNGAGVNAPGATPVSEEQVRRLMDMGFSRDRVTHALQITNNDLAMATNVLLQEA